VPVPISRYRVSNYFLWAGLVALALAAFSAWLSLTHPICWIATCLLIASAGLVLYLATRAPIEIYETHVKIGLAAIPWRHIRRLDRSSSIPLIIRLTLSDKTHILVIYAGDQNTASGLLQDLRRYAREALIDGVPYRQFWGEFTNSTAVPTAVAPKKQAPAPRHPLLLPEDEAEVERMFQRLKSMGHLEEKTSSEDK
jgi:hypothetical protein